MRSWLKFIFVIVAATLVVSGRAYAADDSDDDDGAKAIHTAKRTGYLNLSIGVFTTMKRWEDLAL